MIYTALPCLISHKRFPNSGEVVFVRSQILSSALNFSYDAVSRFLGFVLKVVGVIEAQYLFATSFIFSELFRSVPDFEVRFPLMTSFVNLHHFSILVWAYTCFP